jgi:hypothetical protein
VLVQHFFSAGSFSYTMEHMGAGTNSKKIAWTGVKISGCPKNKGGIC